MTDAAVVRPSRLDALVDYARREPGRCLAVVLALHVVIWTALPALLSHNLQLDLVEDLALGREWQLGYWKHPPLPWWVADLAYRATGDVHAVYLLGPLSAAACMYVVWLLGRDIVGGFQALIAVLALEGHALLQFLGAEIRPRPDAASVLGADRRCSSIARSRASAWRDWLLAGASLALCFWSKYAAFALAGSIGLFLLFDPVARRSLRTPGPWLMALAFFVVIAPNLNWLIETGFMPLRYVDARAKIATHWYHVITFPLQWTASQLFFLAPAIGLMALALTGARRQSPADEQMAFARRYLAMLALGPFAVTTAVALFAGRLPVAMWGYPLWSFAPLAAIAWFGPVIEGTPARRFAAGFAAVFVAMPLAYAMVEGLEPALRDRPKATQFPGRQLAQEITRRWHEKFATPLPLTSAAASSPPTTSRSIRPTGRTSSCMPIRRSAHGSIATTRRRGAVLVWEDGQIDAAAMAQLRSTTA